MFESAEIEHDIDKAAFEEQLPQLRTELLNAQFDLIDAKAFSTILLVSGIGTLLILPALIRVLEKRLFIDKKVMGASCNCVTCIVSSITMVVLIVITLHQYATTGWGKLTWISLITIPVLAIICGLISRRQKCKMLKEQE